VVRRRRRKASMRSTCLGGHGLECETVTAQMTRRPAALADIRAARAND
jgi:hypothetical protein